MYVYTCTIDAATSVVGSFDRISDIVIESQYPMTKEQLRKQVWNKLPEKYVNFTKVYYKESVKED